MNSNLLAIDFSALENTATPGLGIASFGLILTRVLLVVYPLAGLAVLAYLIYGAYLYLTSAGDPKAIQASTKTITYAILGFLILVAAFAVTNALGITLNLTGITSIFR